MSGTHRSPILVTGSHRSGGTWVGRTLAHTRELTLVEEPFLPQQRAGLCSTRPQHWYEYVCAGAPRAAEWQAALERTFSLRYALGAELRDLRSPRDGARLLRDWGRFLGGRMRGTRVLLKDPLAFFSAPWIADTFNARVVVVTRHPAAFASSLQRLEWRFDFDNWLAQPLLMRDWLAPWRREIEAFQRTGGDIIDQAALCWRVLAGVTLRWKESYPNWIFVRHEDLSLQPLEAFRALYETLGLRFDSRISARIEATTNPRNPSEARSGVAHQLRRDSRANVQNWKRRLTPEQIERLRAGVGDVAECFYQAREW